MLVAVAARAVSASSRRVYSYTGCCNLEKLAWWGRHVGNGVPAPVYIPLQPAEADENNMSDRHCQAKDSVPWILRLQTRH